MTRPKFGSGQVVATPGALRALEESGQSPGYFLRADEEDRGAGRLTS